MTQPSLFGKHKLDTQEQGSKDAFFFILVVFIASLFAFAHLLTWNKTNAEEFCKSSGGEVQIIKNGKYSSSACVKDGKIISRY